MFFWTYSASAAKFLIEQYAFLILILAAKTAFHKEQNVMNKVLEIFPHFLDSDVNLSHIHQLRKQMKGLFLRLLLKTLKSSALWSSSITWFRDFTKFTKLHLNHVVHNLTLLEFHLCSVNVWLWFCNVFRTLLKLVNLRCFSNTAEFSLLRSSWSHYLCFLEIILSIATLSISF